MRQVLPRRRPVLLSAALGAVLVLLIAAYAAVTAGSAHAADTLLSQGKTATASSTENATFPASAAVDGNTGTRWSSTFSRRRSGSRSTSAQSATVRLRSCSTGRPPTRSSFQVQTSANGTTWTNGLHHDRPAPAACRPSPSPAAGRYVRVNADRSRHRLRLLALRVPGLRHDHARAASCNPANSAQRPPRDRVLESRTPPLRRVRGRRRQHRHPLVEHVQPTRSGCRSTSATTRWWCAASTSTGRPPTPGRSRSRSRANGTTWSTIYSTTTGTGGDPEPRDQRQRPLHPGVRHGSARPPTATRCGSSVVHTTGSLTDERTPTDQPAEQQPAEQPARPCRTQFWGDTSEHPGRAERRRC